MKQTVTVSAVRRTDAGESRTSELSLTLDTSDLITLYMAPADRLPSATSQVAIEDLRAGLAALDPQEQEPLELQQPVQSRLLLTDDHSELLAVLRNAFDSGVRHFVFPDLDIS